MIKDEKYIKIVSSPAEKVKTEVNVKNQDITITQNGVYQAEEPYTGFGIVTVDVPSVLPVINELNITPITSSQTIEPEVGVDGFAPINVSAVTYEIDQNIIPQNIKEGVSILGVVGTCKSPQYYISKSVNNGVLVSGSTIIDFTGVTAISDNVLENAYYNNNNISGFVNMGSITSIRANGCKNMFYNCKNITGIDLSSLSVVNYDYCCDSMFYGCAGLTSVNLSSLTTASGECACQSMFQGCTGLTSVDLSSLTTVSRFEPCYQMFKNCTNLQSVDLSGLQSVFGGYGICGMFSGCNNLTTVNLSSLAVLTGDSACYNMFNGCTSLTSLSFPALKSNSFGANTNQFGRLLYGITGCTVHFPSNLQSVIGSWSDVTSGFGGTNTIVLFDLPATE